MEGHYLGVLMLGLCCTLPVCWGQGYVNVATNKIYRQISTYFKHGAASNAADGNTAGSLIADTCSHTDEEGPTSPIPKDEFPWWEVDLGRTYPIRDITVWAREGHSHRLYPFTITVDNQTCVSVTSAPSTRSLSVRCTSVMYGQVVRLTLKKTSQSLNLCEFQIFECDAGRWGDRCEYYRCGRYCAIGKCDKKTGKCSACTPGWYGEQCNKACQSHSCLLHTCHQTTGRCLKCYAGYDGHTCTECEDGFSKHNSNTCSPCSAYCKDRNCHGDTGNCMQGCVDGRHGATCNTTCSPAGCQTCHQHSGQCTACRPLYNLDPNSQCKECADGFYRKTANAVHCTECSGRCHNNTPCNKATGDCDRCPPGWEGQRCFKDLVLHSGVSDGEVDKLTGPVVGAITGVGLLLVVSLLLFLCWKQRSQNTVSESDKTTTLALDPVRSHNNENTAPPAVPSPLSAEPQADTQHEIRDPGNPYEQLHIYNNMVFERELPAVSESRAIDVTATSKHADVSPDNSYVNLTTPTSKSVKPRSKKSK
uniref:Fucolectin-related molecule n=1 Tax=Littorina littorea TaxID=31216 RepID=A0A0A7RPY2_LITLI|nr:fucolectin-related molecule [Littorina littorea]